LIFERTSKTIFCSRNRFRRQSLVSDLTRWYQKYHRDLPWRKTKDPYKIWVSEIMLQQTQVSTVIPYYHRFLEAFPDINSLAAAPVTKVLAQWSGLGYYRRARYLHLGARYITRKCQKFPDSPTEISKIPGIGPYTAGAILSIAFDLPTPIVDGNVQRILSRIFGIKSPLEDKQTQRKFWTIAEALVSRSKRPSLFNQAMMELGATVCLKSNPRCTPCPVSRQCVARIRGWQEQLPVKRDAPPISKLFWIKYIWEKDGKVWLTKNTQRGWWQGLWDLPGIELSSQSEIATHVKRVLKTPGIKSYRALRSYKHSVTRYRIHVTPYHLVTKIKPDLPLPGRWIRVGSISRMPVSSLVAKVMSGLIRSDNKLVNFV